MMLDDHLIADRCADFPGVYQPEPGDSFDMVIAITESMRRERRCAELLRPILDHYGYRTLTGALELAATDDVDGQAVTEAYETMRGFVQRGQ